MIDVNMRKEWHIFFKANGQMPGKSIGCRISNQNFEVDEMHNYND